MKSELYAKILEALSLEDGATRPGSSESTNSTATTSSRISKAAHVQSSLEDSPAHLPASDHIVPGIYTLEVAQGFELIFPKAVGGQVSCDSSIDEQARAVLSNFLPASPVWSASGDQMTGIRRSLRGECPGSVQSHKAAVWEINKRFDAYLRSSRRVQEMLLLERGWHRAGAPLRSIGVDGTQAVSC